MPISPVTSARYALIHGLETAVRSYKPKITAGLRVLPASLVCVIMFRALAYPTEENPCSVSKSALTWER
jgi:hypothetical protein